MARFQDALQVIGIGLALLIVILGVKAVLKANRMSMMSPFANQRNLYDIPTGWKDICRDGFKETIVPSGTPEVSPLSPDGAGASYLALSSSLSPMPTQEALDNWGTMTSQRCLSLDQSEVLKDVNKHTNLLQRTNNYPPHHPDSCSAPSHEFLATYYKPAGAIRATPLAGTSFPPSTQCA